ncbi:MAG: hypothetical protein M3Q07_26630 [Pseudobdellovibrionaceae bacterium]|nr:hypothetical protein [Pseudobdellovibrionaceae bacterium]
MDSIFTVQQSQLVEKLCNAIAEHRFSGLERFPADFKSKIMDFARQGVKLQALAQRLHLQPAQLQNWLRSEKSTEEINVFEVSGSSAESSIRIEAGGIRLIISRV